MELGLCRKPVKDMSFDELKAEYSVLKIDIDFLKDRQLVVKSEMDARIVDTTIGFEFDYGGRRYRVTRVYGTTVQVAHYKKSGGLSSTPRYCYAWAEWKTGKSDTPFHRAPVMRPEGGIRL